MMATSGLLIILFSAPCRSWSAQQVLTRKECLASLVGGIVTMIDTNSEADVGTAENITKLSMLKIVKDPQSYEALSFAPVKAYDQEEDLLPLILVIHGAGRNNLDISELADIKGEHAGLIPSLIESGQAVQELTENFSVLAPYSYQKQSFYEEPRGKLLSFLSWAQSEQGQNAGCPPFDPKRVFLFGFSDGATLTVELLTTRKFAGGIVASYGFTGKLPDAAVERLKNVPMWVFHSCDDSIFPVSASDALVNRLKTTNSKDVIKYNRYASDPENFQGRVRGHTMGITASKERNVYRWLLGLPAIT